MSDSRKEKKSRDKVEKKHRQDKSEKTKDRKKVEKKERTTAASAFSLLADDKAVDPTLSNLFAAKPTPPTRRKDAPRQQTAKALETDGSDGAGDLEETSVEPDGDAANKTVTHERSPDESQTKRSRRKRKHDEEEIEDVYMRRLAQEEAKEAEVAATERATKRRKAGEPEQGTEDNDEISAVKDQDQEDEPDSITNDARIEVDEDAMSPPPKHETEQAGDEELAKANRTVFLGNVSTAAIASKTARNTLIDHLKSFFDTVPKPKDGESKHKVESIRFRSTPYASAVPKKAAFATKQLMDATAKSTNAYAVYSSPLLAREAAKQLNASVILGRHLRVDEVAHPAQVDHRRCVFVGNLGFVDDESNIQAANEEDGREKRKPGKQPADIEEGLWRSFGKCGNVESVRVVRDSTTRVGKGIAYVQFEDANAVEAALLYNEKKFPPMLPRKLRVSRAKAPKRNAKPGSGRPTSTSRPNTNGYQRKITGPEASKRGRTGKLYGRAAAAQVKKTGREVPELGNGMKKPEAFVFEGHRASSKGGKSGLKLGGRAKKGGKPSGRTTAFKAKQKKTK